MTHPHIEFEHLVYFEVACRKCAAGGSWQIFSDGEYFVAKHACGNAVRLSPQVLMFKPDEI